MASPAVVLPELLAPEKGLTGPSSNSPSGMLPHLTNMKRLRNIGIPLHARCRVPIPTLGRMGAPGRIRRSAGDLDRFGAYEVNDHRVDAQPGLALLEVILGAVLDEPELPQPLKDPPPLRRPFRQRAVQPVPERKAHRLQRLGCVSVPI